MTAATPRGFRDILPREALARERITDVVRGCFSEHGYLPVETPLLEERSALERGGRIKDSAFQLFDTDQTLLTLRPDLTLPAARLVAELAHLAEQGHNRSLPPCIHVRTESRYGKTAFHGQSEFLQFFRRSSGGPDFAISEFRVIPDLRSEIKHFLTMPVNFPADLKLEFLQIHLFRFPFL